MSWLRGLRDWRVSQLVDLSPLIYIAARRATSASPFNFISPAWIYSTMTEPMIAQKSPFAVETEAGKSYFWCSCGESSKQPFCDGSHKGSTFAPTKFTAEKDGKVFFCGCKKSSRGALCDGTHSKI